MNWEKIILVRVINFFVLIFLVSFVFTFSPINPNFQMDNLVNNIGWVISSNDNNVVSTKDLIFEKNRELSTSVFANRIDPCGMYFDVSDFEKTDPNNFILNLYNSIINFFGFTTIHNPELGLVKPNFSEFVCGESDEGLNVKNMINSNIKVKSIVACSENPTKLFELLTKNNLPVNFPKYFEEDTYNTDFTKVCAIIFKRT